jgi:hypothetical protein
VVDWYVLYAGANGLHPNSDELPKLVIGELLKLVIGEAPIPLNSVPDVSENMSLNGMPIFSTFVTVVPGACVSSSVLRLLPNVNWSDIDGKLIDWNSDALATVDVKSNATIKEASDSLTKSILLNNIPPSAVNTRSEYRHGDIKPFTKIMPV